MNKIVFIFLVLNSIFAASVLGQIGEKRTYNIDFSDISPTPKPQKDKKETPSLNVENTTPSLIDFNRKNPSLTDTNNAGFILNSIIDSENFGKSNPRNIDVFGQKSDVANYKVKHLPNQLKNIEGGAKLIFTDQNLGEINTQSDYLDIYYRDHGQIDGDIIKINVDEQPFVSKVVLSQGNKSVRLYLKPGFTKIDLYSVFDGRLYPNTVEWVIKDDQKRKVADNVLSVSKGFKGTIVVIKD